MNKENNALNSLINNLLKTKTKSQIKDLLLGLLTPKEIEEFAQRIEIVKLLKKGLPQREIAERLGVGVATVTRGSNEIKKGRFKII